MIPSRRILTIILMSGLACAFAFAAPARAQDGEKEKGKLGKIKKDVERKDQDKQKNGDDEGEGGFVFQIVTDIITSGDFWVGMFHLFAGGDSPRGPYLAFPYQQGEFLRSPGDQSRNRFFSAGFSYQFLDDNMNAYRFGWETRLGERHKLDLDFAGYVEETAAGRDYLGIHHVNYGYDLVNVQNLIGTLQGGLLFFDGIDIHTGFELGAEAYVFPFSPFVLEGGVLVGKVNGRTLTTGRFWVGAMLNRIEVHAGMHVVKSPNVYLTGPSLGLRIWY